MGRHSAPLPDEEPPAAREPAPPPLRRPRQRPLSPDPEEPEIWTTTGPLAVPEQHQLPPRPHPSPSPGPSPVADWVPPPRPDTPRRIPHRAPEAEAKSEAQARAEAHVLPPEHRPIRAAGTPATGPIRVEMPSWDAPDLDTGADRVPRGGFRPSVWWLLPVGGVVVGVVIAVLIRLAQGI